MGQTPPAVEVAEDLVAWLLLVLAWVCVGLGVVRIKIANNRRLRALWERMSTGSKLLATLLEPWWAFCMGWEMLMLHIYAYMIGANMELMDEEGELNPDYIAMSIRTRLRNLQPTMLGFLG